MSNMLVSINVGCGSDEMENGSIAGAGRYGIPIDAIHAIR